MSDQSQANPKEILSVADEQLNKVGLHDAIEDLVLFAMDQDLPLWSPTELLSVIIKRSAAGIRIPGKDSEVWCLRLRRAAGEVAKYLDGSEFPPLKLPFDALSVLGDCLVDLAALPNLTQQQDTSAKTATRPKGQTNEEHANIKPSQTMGPKPTEQQSDTEAEFAEMRPGNHAGTAPELQRLEICERERFLEELFEAYKEKEAEVTKAKAANLDELQLVRLKHEVDLAFDRIAQEIKLWCSPEMEEAVEISGPKFVNLDELDFVPILDMIEPILVEARHLSEWAQNGRLDDTGADMLLRLGKKWLDLEDVLTDHGMGPSSALWITDEDHRWAVACCLQDLARGVRKNADWFKYLPEITHSSLLAIAPDASMGMPHIAFTQRLAVAVERLRTIVAEDKLQGQRMSPEEASEKGKKVAKQMGDSFYLLSQRKQAKRIGCSWNTWNRAPFFKEAQKKRVQLTKHSKRASASAEAVSLTDNLQAMIPVGNRDEIVEQLANDEELRRLTTEQHQDREPSPLDDDEPDARPRTVRSRKRV